MGDAADDAFDAAMRNQEEWWAITESCPNKPVVRPWHRTPPVHQPRCSFEVNDDGLYQCNHCGMVTDL